jgi:hypothetical protein
MSFVVFAFALAWKFVAPDTGPIVAMEWKRVLNSPVSAELRREIPSNAVPALSKLNFIDGIERVVWTPTLVVLEGTFDVAQLRQAALADGGTAIQYKQLELVTPVEKDGTSIGLMPSIVLLAPADAIRAAVDRSERRSGDGPSGSYDLWIRTAGSGIRRHDFGLRVGQSIAVASTVAYESEELARVASGNASELQLLSSVSRGDAVFSASLTPAAFSERQWRTAIEALHTRASTAAKESRTPGKIRIYGLDEGVREIPLK